MKNNKSDFDATVFQSIHKKSILFTHIVANEGALLLIFKTKC
jgi:hypothetical protein